jgi:hypothetical protein
MKKKTISTGTQQLKKAQAMMKEFKRTGKGGKPLGSQIRKAGAALSAELRKI